MQNVWLNPHYAHTEPKTAIFADRDGTLIRHVDYIDDPDQVKLLPGVKETVHKLLQRKLPFYILTNQSGVGRGYFSIERVYECQQRFFELLEIDPTAIAGWCIAPEAPDATGGYRKPSPRFIDEACELLGIAAKQTHMIGDTLVDLETAWATGAKAWAVECGKPQLPRMIRNNELSREHHLMPDFSSCIHAIID